ncbi:hypothetical protein G7K_3821-t1 [Saitoella complicata NRRL Y-17804]|uniref:Uncharacterized protein n=1 Tax=Saitoella complicata (strain BCRC 22490 / CBS 7301 / JCM 7358 / NBRC 10748 / NRRL Y-17804) TaxID=698492 RepID=A0A0E9NJU3_SAICN|nr:hypothetical protein G7K_3821-t1 [Saitoella complicata NRRL Y-17804]
MSPEHYRCGHLLFIAITPALNRPLKPSFSSSSQYPNSRHNEGESQADQRLKASEASAPPRRNTGCFSAAAVKQPAFACTGDERLIKKPSQSENRRAVRAYSWPIGHSHTSYPPFSVTIPTQRTSRSEPLSHMRPTNSDRSSNSVVRYVSPFTVGARRFART